ncbi:carboxypeptidase-like regulatory domain-containing protein [Echinicola marina]|uniref:carboxypeptidase-like regulatory domain-containing protein n=1 Tax=Echinicola marina TaxID=2859768 RepID=UPI0021D42BB9|nr:carboxypeptidase-like regulatory domain-containing protein [Echinicola marina]UCS93094.1 carboxypeptidase-like regulatory domain-containing protein [Echinicola marina]
MSKILLAIFSMALLINLEVQAQDRVLSGTVIGSSDGQPIPGVNVRNTATNTGTVTDLDGKYSINVTDETIIEFSFVGYVSQQFTVGNRSSLNVTLEEDLADLSEVVVTALGIAKEKRSLAYSVTEVGGDDLVEAREISLGDQIQGRVAGVNVSNIGSGVAGSSRIVIRGNSSLSGQNQPLFVIDGVPMDNSQLGSAGMWGGS